MFDEKYWLKSDKEAEMFNELEKIVNSYYNKWFNDVQYDKFLYLLLLRYCNHCNSKEKINDIIVSMYKYLDEHYQYVDSRTDDFSYLFEEMKSKKENDNGNNFIEDGLKIRNEAKEIVLEFMMQNPRCYTSSCGIEQAEIFNQCGFGWGNQENATISNQQYWIVALLKQLETEGFVEQNDNTLLWKITNKMINKSTSMIKKGILDKVEKLKEKTIELIIKYMTESRNDPKNKKGCQQSYIFRQCGLDFGNYDKAESTRQQFWVIGALRYLEKNNRTYRGIAKRWFLVEQ